MRGISTAVIALAILLSLTACVPTVVGWMPVAVPAKSDWYVIYSMVPMVELSNGATFFVGSQCALAWDDTTLRVARATSCSLSDFGVFLRYGQRWHPLNHPRGIGKSGEDVLLPANFISNSDFTFLFATSSWTEENRTAGSARLVKSTLNVLAPDRKTIHQLTFPSFCGDDVAIRTSAGSIWMAVIISGDEVIAIVRPVSEAKAFCGGENFYQFNIEPRAFYKDSVQSEVFIGNAKQDGVMRLATRDHSLANEQPLKYIYFDGSLRKGLRCGSVQNPSGADPMRSIKCDQAVEFSDFGFAAVATISTAKMPVQCKYQWRGLDTIVSDGEKKFSFSECHEMR